MIFKRDRSHPHKRARRVNGGRKLGVRRNDEREDFEGEGGGGGEGMKEAGAILSHVRGHTTRMFIGCKK